MRSSAHLIDYLNSREFQEIALFLEAIQRANQCAVSHRQWRGSTAILYGSLEIPQRFEIISAVCITQNVFALIKIVATPL